MKTPTLESLRDDLKQFARERDWEQFHAPKNLAMGLSVEVSEVLEHFQWLSEAQSANLPEEERAAVRLELADVFIYLVRLADTLGIDLMAAARDKLAINAERYPVGKARGRATKYDKL